MYCNYCGKSIQDDANVCAYCGTRVGGVIARKRLVRPREGRKIAGICAGMAEYFDIDLTIVRLVWLIFALCTGIGFIAYLIAWIVIPEEPYLLSAQAPVTGQQITSPWPGGEPIIAEWSESPAPTRKFFSTLPAPDRPSSFFIPFPSITSSGCQSHGFFRHDTG